METAKSLLWGQKEKVPSEVKFLGSQASLLDGSLFSLLKTLALDHLKESRLIHPHEWEILTQRHPDLPLPEIYAGMLSLLRHILRMKPQKIKTSEFQEQMFALGFSENHVQDLTELVYGNSRGKTRDLLVRAQPGVPKLTGMEWNLNAVISNSYVSRVLEPTFQVQMRLSTGTVHSFEMHATQFHHLRHTVASLLREMEDMENRTILKNIQS